MAIRLSVIVLVLLVTMCSRAQDYRLRCEHDSLYWVNEWRLPYPVYQFQTGDIDGDGRADAMVGVIKKTRFHREMGRRLFIFKQVSGKVRPLWLGSKLGGILQDFRFVDGRIRSLEMTTDDRFVVAEYRWAGFGMAFDHYIVKGTDQETAIKYFSNENKDIPHVVYDEPDGRVQPETECGTKCGAGARVED